MILKCEVERMKPTLSFSSTQRCILSWGIW